MGISREAFMEEMEKLVKRPIKKMVKYCFTCKSYIKDFEEHKMHDAVFIDEVAIKIWKKAGR
jgi:hypothetical protein